MLKKLLFLLFLSFSFTQIEIWSKTFGGSDNESTTSVQHTIDGGFIMAGFTESFGNGARDVWLVKTDDSGNEEWNQTFGGSGQDWASEVQQTLDGGFIMVGHTESFGNGDYDIWLIKTDINGIEEWNQTFGGSGQDLGWSVQQTIDNGYIIAARGSKNVIKTDENGNEIWSYRYSSSDYMYATTAHSVKQTIDGGYIIVGRKHEPLDNIDRDVWLMKIDENGIEEWSQHFSATSDSDDNACALDQTTDGGYIVCRKYV